MKIVDKIKWQNKNKRFFELMWFYFSRGRGTPLINLRGVGHFQPLKDEDGDYYIAIVTAGDPRRTIYYEKIEDRDADFQELCDRLTK